MVLILRAETSHFGADFGLVKNWREIEAVCLRCLQPDPAAFPSLMKLAGNLTPEQKSEGVARAQAFVPRVEQRQK